MTARIYCALVHHPVRDRAGDTVTTAVTTLDVHDISRTAHTYGLSGYFVVTPIDAQHTLVGRMLDHWRGGAGEKRMPERTQALSLCELTRSVDEAMQRVIASTGKAPRLVATAARSTGVEVTSFAEFQEQLNEGGQDAAPWLLLFGTGHGLTDELLSRADILLEPIAGPTDYNHLSVRSAAAIIFDRLLGG